VRQLVDNTGALQDTITYDGYGNVTAETNTSFGDRYKYTGRELDAETNLQYNHARYYDPKSGRWTSQDPLGFDAGDSNLYRYVRNAPTAGGDPSGMAEPVHGSAEYWDRIKGDPARRPLYQSSPTTNSGSAPGIGDSVRLGGLVRMVIGSFEFVAGAAGAGTGIGALVAVHGADNVFAGWRTLWTGKYEQGVMEQVLDKSLRLIGLSDAAAKQGAALLNDGITAAGPILVQARVLGLLSRPVAVTRIADLTMREIADLCRSSGRNYITVFTKQTRYPQSGRELHCALEEALAQATPRAGDMFVGRVPVDLFRRLELTGFIRRATTTMQGVRGTEIIIEADAMRVIYSLFRRA
jgi:RHS repeat-associated protein